MWQPMDPTFPACTTVELPLPPGPEAFDMCPPPLLDMAAEAPKIEIVNKLGNRQPI